MTASESWRVERARELLAPYIARDDVVAALVVGSAATAADDEWSDVDTVVVWRGAPDLDWLASAPLAGERFAYMPSEAGAVEQYMASGLKVDVASMPFDDLATIIDDVTERADTEWTKHKVVEGVRDCVVLAGDGAVADLRQRAGRYPDALATAMARQHARMYPQWAADRMALERDDLPLYFDIVLTVVRNAVGLLAAVNRRVHPVAGSELKRSLAFVGACEFAPTDAAERIDRAFRSPSAAAVADLWQLLGETLDLVEEHVPDVDVSRTRSVLALELTAARDPLASVGSSGQQRTQADVAMRPALVPVWEELARAYARQPAAQVRSISLRGLMPPNRRALAELLGLPSLPAHQVDVEVADLAGALGVAEADLPAMCATIRQRAVADARLRD